MKQFLLLFVISCFFLSANSQTYLDSIGSHKAIYDKDGKILSWYHPLIPGVAYGEVTRLASEFIINIPLETKTGEKMYFVTCCFQGPHMHNDKGASGGLLAEHWMHNPACFFAGSVQSLAIGYYPYSGERKYIDIVGEMLDYMIENGTTPEDWIWSNVPYASSDPFSKIYQGATLWEHEGMRGDGLHGIEPDKIGEMGYAYLVFSQITGGFRYLEAAIHCADALAKHVRELNSDLQPFTIAEVDKSPWPFRVNARTGVIISEYCANVVEPIKLFDELLRIQDQVNLSAERVTAYQRARDLAWNWLYSKSGPMKTSIWNAYFEDIYNDPDRSNRNQLTPMETARYLICNPEMDPDLEVNIPALIHWVVSVFGTEGMDAIKEQTECYEPMGSHTSRYASICALWYAHTKDPWYKEQAYRFFNFATYMTDKNGVVRVGPNWPSSWFSDGYSDYIRHFMDGIGAIPEWAPPDENHLVRSTSVITDIVYNTEKIAYSTFDKQSGEVLRLVSKPKQVIVGGKMTRQAKSNNVDGWMWKDLDRGGVLRLNKTNSQTVEIRFK